MHWSACTSPSSPRLSLRPLDLAFVMNIETGLGTIQNFAASRITPSVKVSPVGIYVIVMSSKDAALLR